MTLIFLFIFLCYFVLLIVLIWGWQMAMEQKVQIECDKRILLTVLIPTRNEEHTIQYLLRDLKGQNYKWFEVIVIDDHSEDRTNEVVELEIGNDERFKMVGNSGQGKKTALATGIKNAQGTIVVTTDADCRVGISWLKAIANSFYSDETKLVFGPVKIQSNHSFFSFCQAVEFNGLIGTGVATLMFGNPSMCNGANLAFRKEVFEEVGGYTDNLHLPSGDDEFMLHKVFKKYPHGIRFVNDCHSIVSTAPQLSYQDFINQRMRWAGKWRYHGTVFNRLLALSIFVFQLTSILALAFGLTDMLSVKLGLILWGIKIFIEFIFLRKISIFLGTPWRWLPFLALQIVYPFYVVATGLISNFISFQWKGRILKSIQVKSITD